MGTLSSCPGTPRAKGPMLLYDMEELHNKYAIMKYYHYFNHGIIIKTDTTITMIKFVSYKWDSRSSIKNYGKPVVSNIRNRTTNVNTIKPHKENKRGGIKSGMQ